MSRATLRSQTFAITLAAIACSLPLAAFGSPTSDEFRFCADRTSETLKSCLYRNLNAVEHQCWEVSKDLLDVCNQHVLDQYKR